MKSSNDITRRDFLKSIGLAAAAATLSCTTTEVPRPGQTVLPTESPKEQLIAYPRLPGNKIQPPENGCLIGFQRTYAGTTDAAAQDVGRELARLTEHAKDYDELRKLQEPLSNKITPLFVQNIHNHMREYASFFGKKPYAYALADTPRLFAGFPKRLGNAVAEEGVVPYIHGKVDTHNSKHNMRLEDIVNGKHDGLLIDFAKGAVQFGQEHGGFFFMTMPEPNGHWFYWCNSSKFIPAWRHIWQIFEDQGANQYATWTWKIYCPGAEGVAANDPELFYPGDKYVDWIGLSAVSKPRVNPREATLGNMIYPAYSQTRKDHPQKPIMQAEFGRTDMNDQARWLTHAYKSIKNDFSALKAAIYYGFAGFGHDSTLNQKSLQTLGEVFKDTYWIMAR